MRWTLQINYWTLGGFENRKPLDEVFAEARAMGYDGVEAAFENGGVLGPQTGEMECRRLRDVADRAGLRLRTVATGACWGASLGHPDPAKRQQALEFTTAYLRAASWLGADTALVIPGVVQSGNETVAPYDEVWEHATRGLWRLLPVAESCRVAIGLENVWNGFLTDPVAMRTFIDQFRNPWLGAYFDIGNGVVNGCPEHWIRILGHRIKAVHAKNYTRSPVGGGDLKGFGDDIAVGDVRWTAVRDALDAIDYDGAVTAEMIPFCREPDPGLPDAALARDTATKLRTLLA